MCQEKNIIYFMNTVQQNCKLYQHVAIPIPCQLVGIHNSSFYFLSRQPHHFLNL